MYNDDQQKNEEDYMHSLYLRFRAEVESGAVIEYYELNELLDIYDYAQDEGDVMVQMFVFLTASRLYPRNHDFDERMGFFLSYISAGGRGYADAYRQRGFGAMGCTQNGPQMLS